MQTIQLNNSDINHLAAPDKGAVLTIGNFDGVHIGHQEIITVAKAVAARKATTLTVMTFDPHPLAVLHPQRAPAVLTPPSLKHCLLTDLGVDCHLVLNASPEILAFSAEQFVQRFLVDSLRPLAVVEGEDFNFGARRAGSIRTLCEMAPRGGFEVEIVPARTIEIPDGQTIRVSSTIIRYMLGSGNVADAANALARPYRLIGTVCPGRGKGKEIGFPTLNMKKPDQLIPAEGVYAGYVRLADSLEQLCDASDPCPAVFSIGQARTFGDEFPLLIEAHLLVERADRLKGTWMAMDFIDHIRTQHKFTSPQHLAAQIERDCRSARNTLRDT
jgi:riboflavin kinase/FMN adenylyltransferase